MISAPVICRDGFQLIRCSRKYPQEQPISRTAAFSLSLSLSLARARTFALRQTRGSSASCLRGWCKGAFPPDRRGQRKGAVGGGRFLRKIAATIWKTGNGEAGAGHLSCPVFVWYGGTKHRLSGYGLLFAEGGRGGILNAEGKGHTWS